MSVRKVLLFPSPKLKASAARVDEVTQELQELASAMIRTMHAANGIGLAANQVGVLKRVFVMDCSDQEEPGQPIVLFNPEIIWESEDSIEMQEGCLSFPNLFADVTRPSRVRVRYLDLDGNPAEREFDDMWARCAQHEIDHLNGILFVDRISRLKRQMIVRKAKRAKRELQKKDR